jgi:magnesium transporter
MNLKNFMEETDWGFFGVSGASLFFAGAVVWFSLTKLRKLQRVSLWGEQGRRSRGNWKDVDPMPPLPGESKGERLRRLTAARVDAVRHMKAADPDGLGLGLWSGREKR